MKCSKYPKFKLTEIILNKIYEVYKIMKNANDGADSFILKGNNCEILWKTTDIRRTFFSRTTGAILILSIFL